MEILTKEEAGEIAANYMFNFMEEEQGAEPEDCLNAAKNIYKHFTNEELNVEKVLGINEKNFINKENKEFESLIDINIF